MIEPLALGTATSAAYRPYPKLPATGPCIECSWASNTGRAERRLECRTCSNSRRVPLKAGAR